MPSGKKKPSPTLSPLPLVRISFFLCRKAFASVYRDALKTPFLNHYFNNTYRSYENIEIDSYRIELVDQDETSAKEALKYILKIFHPDFSSL